jgi:hypothetical protein
MNGRGLNVLLSGRFFPDRMLGQTDYLRESFIFFARFDVTHAI